MPLAMAVLPACSHGIERLQQQRTQQALGRNRCPYREESKSLAPDGSPCVARTRGVLQRATVTAGRQHFVGKETDRRWELGDDLSILRSKSMEYRPRTTVADVRLREQVATAGVRALMRATNLSQHTLEAIRAG